jgi:hypothetical protein
MRNAKAAMLAAIELYNKPSVAYRDDTVAILLVNAWELLLKALLSKSKQSIFYPKQRGSPYRSLSWQEAFNRADSFFPKEVACRRAKVGAHRREVERLSFGDA